MLCQGGDVAPAVSVSDQRNGRENVVNGLGESILASQDLSTRGPPCAETLAGEDGEKLTNTPETKVYRLYIVAYTCSKPYVVPNLGSECCEPHRRRIGLLYFAPFKCIGHKF